MKCCLIFLLVLCSAFAQQQQQQQTPPPESGAVDTDVIYATIQGVQLHLDIYHPTQPDAAPQPAIILIHGGGWTSLDKSTMRNMGQFLSRRGFIAFAIDYRLFRDAQTRWPAQLDDAQRAVRWVRSNADKYHVDPKRLGAFGHSAGAQIAALLGMEDTRDNSDPALAQYSSKVQAVVDVSGPTDFAADHDAEGVAFLTKFFGGTSAAQPDAWRSASPLLHVAKDNAPFLIVHGTQDENVPMSQSQELFDKLKAVGVPSSFVKVNDLHTFQTPEARRQLAIETLIFFKRYLAANGPEKNQTPN